MVRVKICGLTRWEDAEYAVELGAHALGFIFEPTSKRFLSVVPDWILRLPPYVERVAVYGEVPAELPLDVFHAVQGLGWTSHQKRLHQIAVARCAPDASAEHILTESKYGDAILLDAHLPGHYGGTGIAVDWGLAAEVVKKSSKPIILGGGLTPLNVAEAIGQVNPYAVDVSSGVESSPGVKDRLKLKAFFEAVNTAAKA